MTSTVRTEAITRLLGWLAPGDTVHTILRHRSNSGMFRIIQLVKLQAEPDGAVRVLHLGYSAAEAMGAKYDRDREGIRVSGAGMDMGFHLVYNLGCALWPDGFECTGQDCPSSAHSNGAPTPHEFRSNWEYEVVSSDEPCPVHRCGLPAADHPTKPMHHGDGGYALRHEWL